MSNLVRKRLLSSLAAQGFGQIVNILIQILNVPIFLHFWGKELYGEWLLLSTIPTYLQLSNLGFASAAGTDMTMRVARGDKEGALGVYQSVWVLISAISAVLTLALMLGGQFLPITKWFNLVHISQPEVVKIVILLGLQVAVAQQMGLLGAGFRCDGNYAWGVTASNLQRLAEFAIGVLVLYLGGTPTAVAAGVLVVGFLSNTLIRFDLGRRSPWIKIGWKHASGKIIKEVAGPAIAFMGFPIGHALSLQGVVTVVGLVLGPGPVVIFSTARTLSRFVWQIVNTIANSIWVELSVALGAGDYDMARNLHRRACQASLWLASLFGGLLFIAGGPTYHLWTKGKLPYDSTLFGLLILVVISNSLWATSYTVSMAVNRHQKVAIAFVVSTGISLLISAFLTNLYGLRGTAIALLLIDLAMNIYVLRISLDILSENSQDFFRSLTKNPLGQISRKLASKFNVVRSSS